jgi:hypothetical protein
MLETMDQDDADTERSGEEPNPGQSGLLAEAQLRTRNQAALVRESLVRCPGVGDPAPQ